MASRQRDATSRHPNAGAKKMGAAGGGFVASSGGGVRRDIPQKTDKRKNVNDSRSVESKVLQGVSIVKHDGDQIVLSLDDACVGELIGCINNDIKEVVRQFQEQNRFSAEFAPEMTSIICKSVCGYIKTAIQAQVQLGVQKSSAGKRTKMRENFKDLFQSIDVQLDGETEALMNKAVKDQLRSYRPQSSPHHLLKEVENVSSSLQSKEIFYVSGRPSTSLGFQ